MPFRSKRGVQCIITNSRHCSFGYDQRVELFGSKGMIISENKRKMKLVFIQIVQLQASLL